MTVSKMKSSSPSSRLDSNQLLTFEKSCRIAVCGHFARQRLNVSLKFNEKSWLSVCGLVCMYTVRLDGDGNSSDD